MRKRLLMALSVLALGRGGALAGHAPEGATDYFSDLPVVLSASRLVQTVDEAPAAVTVIDREMIRASGMRDVVDLFRLVPGMVVGMYKGHQPTLGFHGFADPNFRQLQVLIDGVSIYSPMWGGGEWSELPIALEDIERIEVVRGPNAAAYGANSFLGVVNIITRDPAVESGLKAIANTGEKGIGDVAMRYAAGSGDLRYRLTAGQRSDRGLASRPDNRRSNFLNLRSHYRIDAEDELRVQAGYVGGSQGEGVYAVANHTDGPRPRHSDAGSLQLRWTRMRGSDEELWLQFNHAQRSNRDVLPYVLLGTWNYPLSLSYDHRRTDLEMQHTRRFGESARGVWGAQLRSDGARSQTYFGTDSWQDSSLFRLFANGEWRPDGGWIVAGGAMLEKNSITGSSLSPSIAVNRQLLPGHTLRLRLANARRTPTLFEDRLNWRYEAPADMKALLETMGLSSLAALPLAQSRLTRDELGDERIRSREISYLGQFPEQRLSIDLHLFEHRLDRLLGWYKYPYDTILGQLPPGNPKYQYTYGYINSESARVKGRSATARWQPWRGTRIHLGVSRTAIDADGPAAALLSASAPLHTVSMLLSRDLPEDWQFSLGYYRVGTMQVLSGGDPLPATDRVDLRVGKRFRVGPSRGEVALVVQNATDSIPVFELKDIDRRTSWLNILFEY